MHSEGFSREQRRQQNHSFSFCKLIASAARSAKTIKTEGGGEDKDKDVKITIYKVVTLISFYSFYMDKSGMPSFCKDS